MSVTALVYRKTARETPAAGQELHRVIKHGVLLGDTSKSHFEYVAIGRQDLASGGAGRHVFFWPENVLYHCVR